MSKSTVVVRTGICASLVGSAVIHGTVVAHHFQQWVPSGLFFIALQVVEVALALAAVYVWGPRTAQAVVITSMATVVVWLLSRTLGMPIGPATFQLPEPVGVPDVACCFLELAAAGLATPLALARRAVPVRRPRGTGPQPADRANIAMAAVVAAAALSVTAWGLGPAAHGDPHSAHSHVSTAR
jgi:hypothetical protein